MAAQTGTRPEKIRIQKWYNVYKDHITLADYEIHDGMGGSPCAFPSYETSKAFTISCMPANLSDCALLFNMALYVHRTTQDAHRPVGLTPACHLAPGLELYYN